MLIKFHIKVGFIGAAWISFLKLLLNAIQPKLIFFQCLLIIWINLSGFNSPRFFEQIVDVELIWKIDINVNISFPIDFAVYVQKSSFPHVKIVFSVSLII
jgi:hypothetical protein